MNEMESTKAEVGVIAADEVRQLAELKYLLLRQCCHCPPVQGH